MSGNKMGPRLVHNCPGSGVLRECLAQVRYVAAAPPARENAIVGKSRVAATRLQGKEPPGGPRMALRNDRAIAALTLTLLQDTLPDKMAKRRQIEQKVTTPLADGPMLSTSQITEKSS
jgi:hypothetical protein